MFISRKRLTELIDQEVHSAMGRERRIIEYKERYDALEGRLAALKKELGKSYDYSPWPFLPYFAAPRSVDEMATKIFQRVEGEIHQAEQELKEKELMAAQNEARAILDGNLIKQAEKGSSKLDTKDRVFCEVLAENTKLKQENSKLRAMGPHPTRLPIGSLAESVSKIFEASNTRIDDLAKASRKLEEENTVLKATISALEHEKAVMLAYIDEISPNGNKIITPAGIVVVPDGAEEPWGGDPEDPTVYIGGNDPNAKVMFRSKKEPIGPVRTSGSVSISPTMPDEFMKWLKEQPSKAMNTTKKASEEVSAGEPHKEEEASDGVEAQ